MSHSLFVMVCLFCLYRRTFSTPVDPAYLHAVFSSPLITFYFSINPYNTVSYDDMRYARLGADIREGLVGKLEAEKLTGIASLERYC